MWNAVNQTQKTTKHIFISGHSLGHGNKNRSQINEVHFRYYFHLIFSSAQKVFNNTCQKKLVDYDSLARFWFRHIVSCRIDVTSFHIN